MSVQKPQPVVSPLPIATVQTARGLLRLYARLRGELAKSRDGQDVMSSPRLRRPQWLI